MLLNMNKLKESNKIQKKLSLVFKLLVCSSKSDLCDDNFSLERKIMLTLAFSLFLLKEIKKKAVSIIQKSFRVDTSEIGIVPSKYSHHPSAPSDYKFGLFNLLGPGNPELTSPFHL